MTHSLIVDELNIGHVAMCKWQTRCRGLRAAAAYLRGLCALWPQGRIEGSKYVE